MTGIKILNLRTGQYEAKYVGISARQAVIAAHAQLVMKDFNTWDYEKKYGHLVKGPGEFGVYNIGDLCAKEPVK
jgi:hypothetical protein